MAASNKWVITANTTMTLHTAYTISYDLDELNFTRTLLCTIRHVHRNRCHSKLMSIDVTHTRVNGDNPAYCGSCTAPDFSVVQYDIITAEHTLVECVEAERSTGK